MTNHQVYSGLVLLPKGKADENVVKGCIVLEGGAFRGIYSEGVLDAFMEAGINLECTIGTSAGALNGMNYVSGQIGRTARINLEYRHDSRYVGRQAFLENGGVVGFDFAFNQLDDDPFDMERFMQENRRFVAVVTNLRTGKAEYMEKGKAADIMKAIQASASMPVFSKTVMIEDTPYLDGGVADKIPYQWAIDQGYEKIIVIKTRPDDYRRPPMSQQEIAAFKAVFHNYPEFVESYARSYDMYNAQCDEIARLARRGRLLSIAPSRTIEVGRLEKDMEKLGSLYYLGYHDGRKAVQAVKAYLGMDEKPEEETA